MYPGISPSYGVRFEMPFRAPMSWCWHKPPWLMLLPVFEMSASLFYRVRNLAYEQRLQASTPNIPFQRRFDPVARALPQAVVRVKRL